MKTTPKTALAGFSLSLSLLVAGCVVTPDSPHTEAYKGEYYDRFITDNDSGSGIAMTRDDFEYDYPGKLVQETPAGEITNAMAEETYRYAMTQKDANPLGMIETLYMAAGQGSGNAHYELARELTSGVNMEKNATAAQEHLKDAVALNHAEALRVLGLMNIRGDSMAVNIPAGIGMLELAAQTSTRAMRELGYIYQGKAYPQVKDSDQALHYLKEGYSRGDIDSAYLLGETYYDLGNAIDAIEPLDFASTKGHAKAKQLLTKIR